MVNRVLLLGALLEPAIGHAPMYQVSFLALTSVLRRPRRPNSNAECPAVAHWSVPGYFNRLHINYAMLTSIRASLLGNTHQHHPLSFTRLPYSLGYSHRRYLCPSLLIPASPGP